MIKLPKEYKNPDEIIKLLKDRGMTFKNPIRAKIIVKKQYNIERYIFYKCGVYR